MEENKKGVMVLDSNEDRKNFMEMYKSGVYVGKNQDGEDITIVIDEKGMEIKTYQSNNHLRVNYFNTEGVPEGETFSGEWNKEDL